MESLTPHLACRLCGQPFIVTRGRLNASRKRNGENGAAFCSVRCHSASKKRAVAVACTACDKQFEKLASELRRTPDNFCSRSCSAKYHNTHKAFGVRKSRAETLMAELISADWPGLTVVQNDRTLVPGGYEVDVYLPGVAVAVEINGPVHYEPIFGQAKFDRIVRADRLKLNHLAAVGITPVVVDVRLGKSPARVRRIVEAAYSDHVRPLIEKRQGPN